MRKVLFFLGGLSDQDVEWLAATGEVLQLDAGETLIRENEPIGSMYILLDGAMAVSAEEIGQLAVLRSGDIVGEMSLIDSAPPSATVSTVEACSVFSISRRALTERLVSDIGFAARFYRVIAMFLSDRLRGTVRRLGYGVETGVDEVHAQADELDESVLDDIHLAGARFETLLKRLSE
ncbi:MAG: cyclic nucleotide-binding domain-containing protein [Gammaproteobacteria bacterium]|nr:cyclic nucleotide-binding domain-containing protein [Gammaproteobacteria bacterium]